MQPPDRPLPECLTRLLGAPPPRAVAPGDGARSGARASRPRGRALEGVVLRALVYNGAGLVWLAILWQALRRLAR